MMRVPNGSLARSGKPQKEHGRHIFAYCHVHTNQVLYSLTQVLQGNSALKQLPDAGANNNPPKLRKDLWRPLWSLTLPDGKNGLSQGLHAYKKLREFRKQHEMNWESPPELARPTTQEEMDEIQRQLDERGGKKTETVHDIIKKRKKKIRQRMVMDQKANSIADLAAVLIGQDDVGAKTVEEKGILQKTERDNEVAEMLQLAREARNGGLEKIDAQIEALTNRREAKKEGKSDEEASNRSMLKGIRALDKQRRRMEFSVNAVTAAEQGYTWLPNELAAEERDRALEERVRVLKGEIQVRREAEAATAEPEPAVTEAQPLLELASEEAIVEEQAGETSANLAPEGYKPAFKHRANELMLELEMIRRLHSQPDRVEKALSAYTARQRDIDQLRRLASHWQSMLGKVQARYQERLTHWEQLQATVDSGEDAVKSMLDGKDRYPKTETGDLDFAAFRQRTPARRHRINGLRNAVSFLNEVVLVMRKGRSVEEVEQKLEKYAPLEPARHADFVLKLSERGRESQLKVMGRARARAVVLAKAKVEARAAELAEQLARGGVVEDAEGEQDGEGEAEIAADEAEPEAEELEEPTAKELFEAVQRVRRLSNRVRDIDNIALYKAAVQQLSRGQPLHYALCSQWANLDVQEQLKQYKAYLDELKQRVPALQRARQILAQPDGAELLVTAAEDARERSVAARDTGDEVVAQEQKQRAKVFETVASLRQFEDLILSAPETAVEEPVEQQEETVEAASETPEPTTETPESARSQQQNENGTPAPASAQPTGTSPPEPRDYHTLLPSFPRKTTLPKKTTNKLKSAERQKHLRLRAPVFTVSGVTVKWNNMLDAEYAESWPSDVRHEPMGLSRHTAPRVDQEAIFDVAQFKNEVGGGYKGKRFERRMEEKGVREGVRGVTERVLEAVVRREEEGERVREAKRKVAAEERRKQREEETRVFEMEGVAEGEGEKPVEA